MDTNEKVEEIYSEIQDRWNENERKVKEKHRQIADSMKHSHSQPLDFSDMDHQVTWVAFCNTEAAILEDELICTLLSNALLIAANTYNIHGIKDEAHLAVDKFINSEIKDLFQARYLARMNKQNQLDLIRTNILRLE